MRRTSCSAQGQRRAAALPANPPKGEDMTIAKTPSRAASGYWTVQVVNRDPDQVGRRYLCRARDDRQAVSMAGHLAGSARSVAGYDYHRLDGSQQLHAPALHMGQSVGIDSPALWAALQAPRRTA
jgi:hypothetical protein